jgi:hypothetical protein
MDNQQGHYVIGDIHGCYDELLELEEKIKVSAEKSEIVPHIISVGDLIDRGPNSNDVIEHFRKGVENGTHTVVMGNHELMMLETLEAFSPENYEQEGCNYPDWFLTYKINYKNGKGMSRFLSWNDYKITTRSLWLGQGGYSTLKSFGCDPHDPKTWEIPNKTLSFLIKLPFFYEKEKFVITHALANSEDLKALKELIPVTEKTEGLNDEQIGHLRKAIISLVWSRNPPKNTPAVNKKHISGHTPVPNVKRFGKINCIQIDTGCVFNGRLTALCMENDKILSVKARKNYAI